MSGKPWSGPRDCKSAKHAYPSRLAMTGRIATRVQSALTAQNLISHHGEAGVLGADGISDSIDPRQFEKGIVSKHRERSDKAGRYGLHQDTTYAARDLPFPDRAALAFLTRVVVADAESKCAAAAVSRDPSSDVVRISR
jgi:hypothetical protein